MAKQAKEGAAKAAPIDQYRQADPPPVAAAAKPAKTPKAEPDGEPAAVVQQLKKESPRLIPAIALARPFNPSELKWKPGMVKGSRCLAMVYIDARLVMDRLDEVLGVAGWTDTYKVLEGGCVRCTLTVDLGGVHCSKSDVGSPSEQPDTGDRLKAAFSDALKRTAVKLGVGRYLYRLPPQWVDYDPVKKRVANPPQLPAFAIPKAEVPAPAVGYVDPSEVIDTHHDDGPEWKGDKLPQRPSGNGKPAAAATPEPEVKKDSVYWVGEWRRKLSVCDTPDALNGILPQLKDVPKEFKKAVWDFIHDMVKGPPVNWDYDPETKSFFLLPEARTF